MHVDPIAPDNSMDTDPKSAMRENNQDMGGYCCNISFHSKQKKSPTCTMVENSKSSNHYLLDSKI
jgi:hypothetical protein